MDGFMQSVLRCGVPVEMVRGTHVYIYIVNIYTYNSKTGANKLFQKKEKRRVQWRMS